MNCMLKRLLLSLLAHFRAVRTGQIAINCQMMAIIFVGVCRRYNISTCALSDLLKYSAIQLARNDTLGSMEIQQLQLETAKEKARDSADAASTKDNNLDALISNFGQFGRFQIINCVLLCIPIIFNAFNSLSYVFTASQVVHRCNISQCDNLHSNYIERWLNFTIPENDGEWDECKHFVAMPGIEEHCEGHHFNSSDTVDCEAGYKFRDEENTISSEFEIFCADRWKLSMVGTVSNIGYFVGVPLGGYLADRYGRKSILVAAGTLNFLSGLAQSNAPDYYSFLFFEFLNMLLSSTLFPTAFLLAMELVSPKHRVMAVMVLTLTRGLAGIALGYIAGYILDWRVLLRVIYTPGLLHLFLMCCLSESVRWLLSQSKEEDAIQILRKVARVNQRPLPEDQLRELIRKNRQLVAQSDAIGGHYSVRQICNALGLRIALCCFVWFSNLLITLGLILNLKGLSGSKFRNFSLTSFMKLPGILIPALLMNRIGRRWAMSLFLGCCSTLLVAIAVFDEDYPDLSWYLYFLAIMTATCSLITLHFFTSEIFPTNCRNSLLSFCATMGSFGYMLAPQTPLLVNYYKYAPHLLFATFGFLSAIMAMFFPETANKVLPTTLEEARALDKNMPI